VSPATITYNFAITANEPESVGATNLNVYQRDAARLSIELWDDLIAPNFAPDSTAAADITLASSSYLTKHGSYAYTYSTWWNSNSGVSTLTTADVWFSIPTTAVDPSDNLTSPVVGGYNFMTFLHELGHALGLNHMGNYDGTADARTQASGYEDSSVYSIMSYFGPDHDNGNQDPAYGYGLVAWANWKDTAGHIDSPQTPMLEDILAIQAIYGASTTTRTGDTVYGFNSTVKGDEWPIYDFTFNHNPILCIWDSSGNDTIDLSGYSTNSRIDLHAGSFSDCNGMTNNISIAYNCAVENAVGGAGNDTLIGNDLANVLKGGGGNDSIDGAGGEDRVIYSGDYGDYLISLINAALHVTDNRGGSPDGTDTVTSVELFTFADGDYTYGQLVDPNSPAPHLSLASDTGKSATDRITSNGTVNVGGLVDGATWQYSVDFGEHWLTGTGSSFSLSGDGQKTVLVHQTDQANNVSEDAVLLFSLDTVAPTVSSIFDQSIKNGYVNAVNNTQHLLSGTAPPGYTIHIFDGQQELGTSPTNAFSYWSFFTGPLTEGVHQLSAMITDPAGNTAVNYSQVFTVDTVALAPHLSLVTDTGAGGATNADAVTRYGNISVGGIEPGANWEYSIDNGKTWKAGSGSTFSFIGDGAKTVLARQIDLAGNESSAGSLNFTLDTIAPTAPSKLADAAIVKGIVNGARNLSMQNLTGAAGVNTAVDIYVFGVFLNPTTANSKGVWTFNLGALADGSHSLTAKAEDVAGNISVASAALNFTVDTTKPAAPTFVLANDTGLSGTDRVTRFSTLNGVADAGNVVTIKDGTTSIAVTAAVNGTWTYKASGDRIHNITVTQADTAGNVSDLATMSFTLDTTAPAVAITTKGAHFASHGAGTTTDVTIAGTGEGGASVQIYDGASALGASVTIDSTGHWTDTITFAAGTSHSITAIASDLAGNTKTSPAITIVTDNQINNVNGTSLADHIIVDSGFQTLSGGLGDDVVTLQPQAGNYHVDGGSGIDMLDFSLMTQAVTVDLTKTLSAGPATATGADFENAWLTGFENVTGGSSDDTLLGDKIANVLVGAQGADILNGGAGADTLTGGSGTDTFVFNAINGKDVVTDFNLTEDIVKLDHTVFGNWAAVDAHLANSTLGVMLKFDSSDAVTFTGITKAMFEAHQGDFVFA